MTRIINISIPIAIALVLLGYFVVKGVQSSMPRAATHSSQDRA